MKRVLVVDDDPLVCKLVAAGLEEANFAVKIVHDGKAAFDLARLLPFDLLVLDVVMPEMDGFQLLRELRSRPETAMVPVIFLTAQKADEDRVLGFKLGADDYLPKPFNIDELVMRVERILKHAPARKDRLAQKRSLEGTLDSVGLGPLLTLLEMEHKSGLLRLSNERSKAILYLKDGNVIRTRRNSGGLRNEEIVYDALHWTEGSFQFKPERVSGKVEIELSTIQLLMEASRRMDERVN